MKKEKALKKQIENYLLSPILVSFILIFMCIGLFFVDTTSAVIASTGVFIVVVVQLVVYFVTKASVMPSLFRFAQEQGQIQKELLKELVVPYALLDTDGKILWGNKAFVDAIGEGSKKRIRKNISAFFPEIGSDTFSMDEQVNMDLEFNEVQYNALIKKVYFDEVFQDEDAIVDPKGQAIIAIYLFDETELKRYKKENEEQKLVAGLIYIDNYEEVMENTEEVRHSLVEALVDRRINMYLATLDAICKKTERDKYLFVCQQKYLAQMRDTKFALLDEVQSISRELMLIKVKYNKNNRRDIMETCEIMKADIVDMSKHFMIIQICDVPERIQLMINMLQQVSIVEVARTGTLALQKCAD